MFCTEAATTHVSIREIVQSLKWNPYNVDNSPVTWKNNILLNTHNNDTYCKQRPSIIVQFR